MDKLPTVVDRPACTVRVEAGLVTVMVTGSTYARNTSTSTSTSAGGRISASTFGPGLGRVVAGGYEVAGIETESRSPTRVDSMRCVLPIRVLVGLCVVQPWRAQPGRDGNPIRPGAGSCPEMKMQFPLPSHGGGTSPNAEIDNQ
jgi:hypothetical protein